MVWSGGERYSQTLLLLLLRVLPPAHPPPWSAPTSNSTFDIHSVLQAGAPQPLHCSRAPSHPRVLPIVSISLPTCLPKYRQRCTSESISGLWSPAAQQTCQHGKAISKNFKKINFLHLQCAGRTLICDLAARLQQISTEQVPSENEVSNS